MTAVAFTPYELFRLLIERVGWPTEAEKQTALDTVNQWERMGIFGNLVNMVACPHENKRVTGFPPVTKCEDCGRTL